MGAQLGDAVIIGHPGDLIFKPRNQWHTFWNAGDAPARILEIISPAVENYFRELGVELKGGAPDPQRLAALCARYELDMDIASVPGLMNRFGVRFYALRVNAGGNGGGAGCGGLAGVLTLRHRSTNFL